MGENSIGVRLAGKILIGFGVLALIAAALIYLYAAGVSVMVSGGFAPDVKEGWMLVGLWLLAVFVHACGLMMVRAGDYMLGRFEGLTQRKIMMATVLLLLKDLCIVQLGFGIIFSICCVLSGSYNFLVVVLILMLVFVTLAFWLNGRLILLEKKIADNAEPVIFL